MKGSCYRGSSLDHTLITTANIVTLSQKGNGTRLVEFVFYESLLAHGNHFFLFTYGGGGSFFVLFFSRHRTCVCWGC